MTAESERAYVFGCLFIYSLLVDQSDRIRLPLPYLTTRKPSNGENKTNNCVSVCFSLLKHEQSNRFSKKKIIINLRDILPSFLPHQTRKEKTDHRSIDGLQHDSRTIQLSLVTDSSILQAKFCWMIFDKETSADVHYAFLLIILSPVALVLCR